MDASVQSTARLLRDRSADVVDQSLRLQWERWPHLQNSFSDEQLAATQRDTRYHIEFLASSLWVDSPEILADYVNWNISLFNNIGLPVEWLFGSLDDIASAIQQLFEPASANIAIAFLQGAVSVARQTNRHEVSTHLPADSEYGALALRYLSALLGEQRHEAARIILDAVDGGVPLVDVYLQVLQPVLREVGLMWQTNKIGVAQEHYATAATQVVMSQLYEHIFDGPKNGRRLVAACVGGELHEVGMRMVADIFEVSGWDTYYIGANTPTQEIVETVARQAADVLALSATMSTHLPALEEVIQAIRADERTRYTKVLVGGYPFNVSGTLWSKLGADGSAQDALGAIDLADRLVGAES